MSTGWSHLQVLKDRCNDYYERIEYVRFINSNAVSHTCKDSVKNALAYELVSVCGRVNAFDIKITQSVNDALDVYDRNGTPFSVIIPAGNYTWLELGDSLQGLLEAASGSTESWAGTGWDAAASRYQFVVDFAPAGLNFGTGPGIAKCAWGEMGFPNTDVTGASPYLGAVPAAAVNRSHCYHITSDFLGRGRRWGVNDSDGPTGSYLWVVPSEARTGGTARVSHYPPNLTSFAWGNTNDIHEFDLNLICDSDYLVDGSHAVLCDEAKFTGVVVLRFIVARMPEI